MLIIVEYKGGGRGDRVSSLPLDEVYVVPDLVPEREREQSQERARELVLQLTRRREECDPGELARMEIEYLELAGRSWRLDEAPQSARKPLAATLGDARHAVVIGTPGVGKSTLARFLTRVCALGLPRIKERLGWDEDLVPLMIPLASFAEKRREVRGLTLREFVHGRLVEKGGEVLALAVEDVLLAGDCLVLLDGVDEIPELSERIAVIRAAEEFIRHFAGARFVVTSRPYGYERLNGDIAHFHLPNFTRTQVNEFVHNRQRAAEIRQHPEAPDLRRADAEAASLLEEIRHNPKVAELATNQLILVIVSIIRYEQARLPQERVQLYNRAIETLMDTWNACRSDVALEIGGVTLPRDRLIRVWATVAAWMRSETNTGVVHREALKRKLVEVLEAREYDEDEPEATAEAYLVAAAARAGLLEERGPGIFAFWHPTFEEFLAAVETATPLDAAGETLLRVCDDPRWREVVLLSLGYVGVVRMEPETASRIIGRLLVESLPVAEPLLHSRLLTVAACIADGVGVRREQVDQVLLEIAEVVTVQPYEPFVGAFGTTVKSIPKHRPGPALITKFTELVHHPHWRIRMEVARLTSNVVVKNAEALQLCRELIRDNDPDVRCHAALGLARAGDYADGEVIRALGYCESTEAGAEELVNDLMNTAPAEFVNVVERYLIEDRPDEERLIAARLLRDTGRNEVVVPALLGLVQSQELPVRLGAVRELRRLDHDMDFKPILSEMVAKGDITSIGAWEELQLLGGSDTQSDLIGLLESGEPVVSLIAAIRLQTMGRDETAGHALLSLIRRGGKGFLPVFYGAHRAVGREEDTIEVLYEFLSDDDPKRRLDAARLLRMSSNDDRIVYTLRELVTNEDPEVRVGAATQLQQMGRTEGLAEILRKLVETTSVSVRVGALRVLLEMDDDYDWLVPAVLALLESDDPNFRDTVIPMSVQLLKKPNAAEAFVRVVEPVPWQALAAVEKARGGEDLSEDDVRAVTQIVTVRQTDTHQQKSVRQAVFHWVRSQLVPGITTMLKVP